MKTRKKKINRKRQTETHRGRAFKLFFFSFVILFSESLYAQSNENVFLPAEKLTYGAFYNLHFIWVNAGEVVFQTDTVTRHDVKRWEFEATGKSYKAYDFFYTVRDTFLSRVTYGDFGSDYFIRKVNHAKKSTIHQYHFDHVKGKIYSYIQRSDGKDFHDTLVLKPTTSDMLSTVYTFRNFNFNRLQKGERVSFSMLVDNKDEDLYFRYLGKEEVKTRNGRRFLCHKVLISLLGGDFFPDGEYMNVWFTADQNHIPVRVETEILVGSVNAILTDFENLKYPLTSEIK